MKTVQSNWLAESRANARKMAGTRLSVRHRAVLALVAAMLACLLGIAATLTPDPRGFGTHAQLGLGECFVENQWGVRCPSCGMTTAWTRLLQGDVPGAVAANAAGAVLCVLALLAVPWLLATMALGRWWYLRPTAGLVFPLFAAVAVMVLVDWIRHTGLALVMERIP